MNFRPSRRPRAPLAFAFVLLVVVIAFVGPLRDLGTRAALAIGIPLARAFTFTADILYRPFTYVQSQERLLRENAFLRGQAQLLAEERLHSRALEVEQRALMAHVGRQSEAMAMSTLVAPSFAGRDPHLGLITSRPLRSLYDTLVIDQGREQGIVPGMAVFSLGGILLGEVDLVQNTQSRVVLFSSTLRTTDVLIGSDHLAARAEGVGGGNLQVEIPHGTSLVVGDLVTAVHDTPWLIGTVGALDDRAGTTLARVLIKSPINFQTLKWVVVTSDHLPVSSLFLEHATTTATSTR
ncbi:MAG: hypothetical protein A2542_03690 [Parcubacteria group bacterium RIFOXYD2_FULL_52_8]|nr:MAG: hypothetical protein A2542_03690 [Parcubacteria group bacterium RIFOXYD2_FULL_52_8]